MLDNTSFHEQIKGFFKKKETCLVFNVSYSDTSKIWEWTPSHTSKIWEIPPRWGISSQIIPSSHMLMSRLPLKSSVSCMAPMIIQMIVEPAMLSWTALIQPSRHTSRLISLTTSASHLSGSRSSRPCKVTFSNVSKQ